MRPISRLRHVVSTIATAGLVLGGIYLGASPASAASEQTLLTLTPALATVEAGTGTTISVDVQMCQFDETNSCVAPQGFGTLGAATSNSTYLQVQSSPGGAWTKLTLAAAADGSSPATYLFSTGNLSSTTTFTFRMGTPNVNGTPYWYGTPIAGDPGIRLLGTSADTTITLRVAPSVDTGTLALDPMSVDTPFSQTIDWSNYVTGTDLSSVTFAGVTGLPDGVIAEANSGSTILISGTPTSSGSGTAHLNLLNGPDPVPGTNTMTWTVDSGVTPTPTPSSSPSETPTPEPTDTGNPCVDPPGCGQPPADTFDLSTLDLGTMTVGTTYTNSFDLSQYISGTASAWHIGTVVGLPEGVSPDYTGLQLDLTGAPTVEGSDVATVTLTDGQNFLVGEISWTVEAATFTPGQVFTPTAREWNLAQDIGAFSVRAELYTSGFDWSDGGKITVTGLPQGMTYVPDNAGSGPGGLWSAESQAPSGSVMGASAISGSGTFDVSYTDKFETQTVTVDYTVTSHDSLNTNGMNYAWSDDTGIGWDAWGTAPLTKAVLFLNGSPVAAYTLPGTSRGGQDIPAADFRTFSDVYATNGFTVRTYYSIQLNGDTMPTLATPYSAETSFNRAAEPIWIGASTMFVNQGDAGVDFTYSGPSCDLIVAYLDGFAVDTFTKNDGDRWHADFAAYGLADRPHFLSLQVFNLAGNATAPAYDSGTDLAARSVWFIPSAVISDITLNPLQVGVPFTQTIDLADYTTGFWWEAGGSAYLSNLPTGLTYEVLNATSLGGAWSLSGQAPIVRIYGTPPVAGTYQIGVGVNDHDWGNAESSISGTIAAESIPSLDASSIDLSRNDTTTLTYGGPDGSIICAEITLSVDLLNCTSIDNGQQVSYDYNTLMTYYANLDWDLSPWTAQQLVQFRVWTPAAMATKGVNLNLWPGANVVPSNSISVTLEPTTEAASTEDFVLPQFQVGVGVELTYDMSEYTTGFDWTNEGDMYLATDQLPPGLNWEYGTGDSGAPVLHIWGTPTEADFGTVYVDVYDNFWGEAETDLPWNVAPADVSTMNAEPANLSPGQSSTITWDSPFTETLAVAYLDGQIVNTWTIDEEATNIAAAYSDFNAFGDMYADRNLEIRLFTDQQWETGAEFPTYAAAYDAMLSMTLFATPTTLTPDKQVVAYDGSASVQYVGSSDRLYGLYVGAQLVTWGRIGQGLDVANTFTVPWYYFGSSTDTTVTLRIYPMNYTFSTPAPAFGDSYAATASALFEGYTPPEGTVTPPELPQAWIGVSYDETFDVSTLAGDMFDWTWGGGIDIQGLPEGLSFELLNPYEPGASWSVNGEAPLVRIFGVPTATSSGSPSLYVEDDNGTTASTTFALPSSDVTFTATPDDLRAGMSSQLIYTGPPRLMMCVFLPDVSDAAFECGAAGNFIHLLPYEVGTSINGGSITTPVHLTFRAYPFMDSEQPPTFAPSLADGGYLTDTTITFEPVAQLTLPSFENPVVGQPFEQFINLDTHSRGFDWSQGGTASVTGLPAGLQYEITNAGPDGTTTGENIAPIVRIYGTPTEPTDGAVTYTVSANDLVGNSASVDGSMTVDAPVVVPQLSPASQTLSIGQTISFAYDGPSSRVAAIWSGDQLITWGSVEGVRTGISWGWYAGVAGDSTVDHNFSLRVYPSTYSLGAEPPAANDVPETSSTIAFKGNVPTIDAVDLGALTVGTAVDKTFEMTTYAHGFDWSVYGGRAEVTGLPAGLTAEMTNSVNGPWSTAGVAPVLHVTGTPLEAGPYTATLNVYDAAFGEGGQSATAKLEGSVAAEAISLSPAELLVTFGDTGFFDYNGPSNREVAFFNSANQVVASGSESLLDIIPWGMAGSTTDVWLTVRVYSFASGSQVPTYDTEYAAQSTVTFAANSPAVSTMAFGALQVGVAFDKTFDLADDATGFDWTSNGGRVTISDLPPGLQFEVTNAVHGDWTARGVAPIVHIFGTPTTAGGYESTVTVFDSVYGDSGQSASTYPGGSVAMAITLSPSTVDITFSHGLDVTYAGPGDRLAALFDGNTLIVWDRADHIASDINYGMLATHLGGASADHEFQLMVFDMATPMTFPDEYGMPAASTTVKFKSHLASVKPFDFGRMQVGVPYDKSFDLADYGVGFDWSVYGGTVSISGLPAGLQFTLANESAYGWTASGVAPVVRIYGTPTSSTEFCAHVTATDASFPELGQSGEGTSNGVVQPAATLEVLPVGAMVQGAAFTQTFDMANYSANFDWTHGGSAMVSELPAGLSSEITNPMEKGPVVSTNGQAPQLRIFGTPTVHGEFSVTVTLTDEFGATASVDVPVVITTGQVPSDPAPQVTLAGGTATFTIPGLADSAVITPGSAAPGVSSVSVVEGDVVVHVSGTFSGLISHPVTVTQNGADTVVHLVIKVYPTATKNNTFTLKKGKTYVHWSASPNAHSYKVIVNGHVDCTTTVKTTSCTVKGLLGPKAAITVVTVGGNNFTARATAKYVKAPVVAPFGAVLFAADSSKLTVASKLTIRKYAVAITKQGFTTVTVEGYIAHWPSNTSAADKAHGIALSKARAAVVRAYLTAEFKKLGVKVSVKTLGNGGSHPTVSNTLSSSAAGNRRADISVS